MNRALIITVGIVIIILVLGVWIYLMLFGTPEKGGDVFTNLGFEVSQQDTTITPPVDNTPLETLVDTQSNDALRQLTTRPIAGFVFSSTSIGTSVRYAERGTGHIYEIDIATGGETILSGTTLPKASKAVFSPDTNTIALSAYNDNQSNVFVGTLGEEGNIVGISLQPGAENIAFSSNTEVLYTISADGTTKGYRHDINTLVQAELFSMNYTNLDVGWGSTLDTTYLATKPSQELEGFIYTVKSNSLTPATFSAYGLSALFDNDYILTTYIKEGSYASTMVNAEGILQDLPILALKEKCVFSQVNKNYLWCGAPIQSNTTSYVEDWYKGTITSEDYLWRVNVSLQTAELKANPVQLTGRNIDIKTIGINPDGTLLSFINKTDHTLWLFDTTVN
jgi:WD40 repeat protein